MKIRKDKKQQIKVRLDKVVKADRALKVPSKKVAKKLAIELGLVSALVCMTSCGVLLPGGGAMMFATTDAIEAQGMAKIGLVNEARTKSGQKSSHYQLKELEAVSHEVKGSWLTEKVNQIKRTFQGQLKKQEAK